jgi:hypothetical protein
MKLGTGKRPPWAAEQEQAHALLCPEIMKAIKRSVSSTWAPATALSLCESRGRSEKCALALGTLSLDPLPSRQSRT